jgi:diaminohydroxyphosphoribosylaminopyrimidine deaminase/5-amino-6-(5-phosphoribosylamino)uracil reductase
MGEPAFVEADRAFMTRALALAEQGLFTATPNPRVGCVLVKGGRVIGEGFHERAGSAHAEANALADARARGNDPRGATVYVTLEPCNHTGRTPPCADALVAAGVARVVAAMADPNPQALHGAARLREAGIAVDFGVEEAAARELNAGFVSRMTRGRPWVRVKVAASLDGRTALDNGESRWISGEASRADAHRFRARACAIMTGVGTVRADDPALTVRALATPRQPRRIVVDRGAETPPEAKVLAGEGAIVATAGARNPAWPPAVDVIALPDANGRVDLDALVRELASRGVNELHVEAGAGLVGALIDAALVDEWLFYVAPSLIGDPARGVARRRTPLADLESRVALAITSVERIGDDVRIVARTKGRS